MSIRVTLKKIFEAFVKLLPMGALLHIKQIPLVTRLDYPDREIFLAVDTQGERQSRANSCKKEPGTVAWIEGMRKGDVLYDVGANVGPYALIAAARGIHTVAIEPHPLSYAKLCRNIVLNKYGERIVPLPVGLGATTGTLAFNYQDLAEATSGHALGEAIDSQGKEFVPVAAHQLMAYRLDDLIDSIKLLPPTHIKIDVDGIELQVLEGAPITLASSALKSVLVELEKGDALTARAIDLLRSYGFTLRDVYEGRNHLFEKTASYGSDT